MCGIVGTIDVVEGRAEARIAMLNELQQHRGPDHSVVARVGSFTLGNTRLAIQDPGPAGNQPLYRPDGRYHCVFNGEIYNHRRLVRALPAPGAHIVRWGGHPAPVGQARAGVPGRAARHVRNSDCRFPG